MVRFEKLAEIIGHFGKFCEGSSKVIWAKLANFRAKLKSAGKKKSYIMGQCVFVDSRTIFNLLCANFGSKRQLVVEK